MGVAAAGCLLAACGAEVAGSAATAAKLQATAASQAQAQQAQVVNKLDEAFKAAEASRDAAASAAER